MNCTVVSARCAAVACMSLLPIAAGQSGLPPDVPYAKCFVAASAKQCSARFANTTRTCDSGTISMDCYDIVLAYGMVPQVRAARSGETGQDGFFSPPQVTAIILTFECTSENRCRPAGLMYRYCIGREPFGDDCEGELQ